VTTPEPPLRGERDLDRLLATMAPVLDPARYAFCRRPDAILPPGTTPLSIFCETEGVTLILEASVAARLGYSADFLARRIILTTHSDLGAVGFLARVSAALAAAGVPSNAVSAAYHDHLFVPEQDADRALALLSHLQRATAEGQLTEVLYSVTVHIDASCADEWVSWMRAVHVPEVLRAGGFLGCTITREIAPSPQDARVTFVLDYRAPSLETLDIYRARHAATLQQAHTDRYSGRFEASRSVRAVLAYPSPEPRGA
jgi:uncharacterized protein